MTAAERALQEVIEAQARYEQRMKRIDLLENIALGLVFAVVVVAFVCRLFL